MEKGNKETAQSGEGWHKNKIQMCGRADRNQCFNQHRARNMASLAEETDKDEMPQHVVVQRGNGSCLLRGEWLVCDKTASTS